MSTSKHKYLLTIVKEHPDDYEPWGDKNRDDAPGGWAGDCSCDCKFAIPLEGDLGADWVVCTNADSHRVGLLTFEHQGCLKFEPNEEEDEEALWEEEVE